MKVTVDLKKMLKFQAFNRDCRLGQYFGEDDWNITVYAETIDELRELVAKEFIDSRIDVISTYLTAVQCLCWKDYIFETTESCEDTDLDAAGFYLSVLGSETYKNLLAERNKKDQEKKDVEKTEKKAAEQTARLAEYKRLQQEFGDNQ